MSHEELASYQSVFNDIKLALEQGRRRAATHVNHEMLITYWNIGRIIVEHEQTNPNRAEYGTATLRRLSRELTETYGKGFSVSNIQFMRRFYLAYEKQQTLSVKLSWSYYCELLIISDLDKRHFYECECIAAAWSARELKRQIATSLYERRLLSGGASNPQRKLAPSNDKSHALQPIDIIKDPYVFEFLGIPDNASLPESELERVLVAHMEKFLLELGQGFMFVGTQQRITLNNAHYYVDMVFYNKLLRAYVLVELKTSKLMPEAVGQINMYLNYYAREMNDEFDNPPIGIILCTDKDAVTAEYALGGLQNAIFASRYVSHVPDKEQLVQQAERALMDWERSESARSTRRAQTVALQ
ncbi:PDDEXK nuclease domain-containing protein [Paraeggerthella sp.]|uniref:PDDEXK nuclease domain-containing protein n=1 Tax=Paraeggerthella sp. TaxID=2897350 RepID=UPI003AB3B49E